MAKPDFSKLLSEQMAKAAGATRPPEFEPPAATPIFLQPVESPPESTTSTPVQAAAPAPAETPLSENIATTKEETKGTPAPVMRGSNLNRVTVNLFDADRRALAVIKEKLGSTGHDFTNRSDSIKIGLRLAAKAGKEELSALLNEVRSEDRRFSTRV